MKKSKMISLTYTFIFDNDAQMWDSVSDFERDLSDFFSAYQLEAEVIKTVDGSSGNRMMFLEKMEEVDKLLNTPHVEMAKQQMPTERKAESSYKMVKRLTDSIGKGRRA